MAQRLPRLAEDREVLGSNPTQDYRLDFVTFLKISARAENNVTMKNERIAKTDKNYKILCTDQNRRNYTAVLVLQFYNF